eukprot:NODE_4_length_77007_cov_1.156642.p72 type:complete len:111 gc:universal NODE_4_length_77007_cov_1.156642:23957-23625(-)
MSNSLSTLNMDSLITDPESFSLETGASTVDFSIKLFSTLTKFDTEESTKTEFLIIAPSATEVFRNIESMISQPSPILESIISEFQLILADFEMLEFCILEHISSLRLLAS